METKANYLMVGVFVVVMFVGLIGFVLWLGKFQADVAFDRYKVYFSGSVSGLRIGSPVSYRGVTVGEVVDAVVAGDVEVPIAATYPLAEVRDAFTVLDRRQVRGKVVLHP